MGNMKQKTWKQKTRPVLLCMSAYTTVKNETTDMFTKSWCGEWSPLLWRIPILVWAVTVMSLSVTYFWGPRQMFLLYMTHWGLVLIVIESLFGVIVAAKTACGGINGVLLTSATLTPGNHYKYWFLYFTSWGFLCVVFTTGISTVISVTCYYNGPIDATFGLPWYVKTYWVLYNITIPVAFLITAFYWGILRRGKNVHNFAPDPVLDVMLHATNSLVMLLELISSAHPSRLMHIMQPLYFALAYVLFTVLYYIVGGSDPWGNAWVYPVLDWSKPEKTMVVVTLTALFLALMHLLVVGIATARDAISRRYIQREHHRGVHNDAFKA